MEDYSSRYQQQQYWEEDNQDKNMIAKILYYPIAYAPKFFALLYQGVWNFVWRWLK